MTVEANVRRIDVAVGVLISENGEFLMTSRPEGKVMAGYWEFPGGKVERGECVDEALCRELQEELGIHVVDMALWQKTEHDYPHALVRLHWFKVYAWVGELVMRDGQSYAWQRFPLSVSPILPGALPILACLEEELASS